MIIIFFIYTWHISCRGSTNCVLPVTVHLFHKNDSAKTIMKNLIMMLYPATIILNVNGFDKKEKKSKWIWYNIKPTRQQKKIYEDVKNTTRVSNANMIC